MPIGIESVTQYKKALMALPDYQFATRQITWPSPKVCKEVKNIIKEYSAKLIYDQVQTHADRAAHCIIRDSYRVGQLIRILLDLWCSNERLHLRERFSIAARHHMLLRDQNLRNLNFSDCFSTIISRTQHRGVQQAVALLFCLDKGKTLKVGEVKFACATRYYNLYRCPFSAFAFYMFSKLQEEPPFLKNSRWHNFKVLLVDKEEGISAVQQYKATKQIFLDHGIHTSRVTHGGRHAGAMEAESLGIPTNTIKKGGGWKDRLGRLVTHYLGKVPSEFARGMAGFWTKPFALERNRVDPSIELQQLNFPWIENFFGAENMEWKVECLNEMTQIYENEFREEARETEFVEEVGQSGRSQIVAEQSAQAVNLHQSVDASKRSFLKMLIRCRRIILQDAAVYLLAKKENYIVNTHPSAFNLFRSHQFKAFQEQVKVALETPMNDRLREYENIFPHLVDSQNEVSSRIAGFDQQLNQSQVKIQREVADIRHQKRDNQDSMSKYK